MSPTASRSVDLKCAKCQGALFELRILKDEGLAAARCEQCDRNYLLLDSEDYWFDVIQKGFPKISRCGCKSAAFKLRCEYSLRDDGDVAAIVVWTTCSSCGKTKRQMNLDIDYGPTQRLIDQPLVYCRNPRILYDLREITLYATPEDIARVAAYLEDEAACAFHGAIRVGEEWVVRELGIEDVKGTILGGRYVWIYASPIAAHLSLPETDTARSESSFWKHNEVVRISSPTSMNWKSATALLYYLQFSNEYVGDERIVPKSARFRKMTSQLLDWLASQFVSWRGRHCFDNPAVHQKVFGERFRAKAPKGGKR